MSKERDEFVATLAREFPQVKLEDLTHMAATLMRLARIHGRICLAECNGKMSSHDACVQVGQIEREIERAIKDLPGVGVEFEGDPRGYTVRLLLPSKRSNSLSGIGWGIPQ